MEDHMYLVNYKLAMISNDTQVHATLSQFPPKYLK